MITVLIFEETYEIYFWNSTNTFWILWIGYIDDNDIFQYLQEKQKIDKDGLKDCKTYDYPTSSAEIIKGQALEKVQNEIRNNQQLRIFLSKLPKEQQRKIVQDMLDAIMDCTNRKI